MTRVFAAVALALLLAGCAGGDGDAAPPAQTSPAAAARSVDDARPGRTLLTFVRAAGDGDAEAMWGLLTRETRASMGPTLEQFRTGTAVELEEGVGSVADTAEVTLSRRVGEWGVGAVSGERTVEGEREDFSYAAALAREEGRWKLELGALVIGSLRPEPLEETTSRAPFAATVNSAERVEAVAVWLDGREVPVPQPAATAFTVSVRGITEPLDPGRHELVVFAATADAAGAIAWPFTVAE